MMELYRELTILVDLDSTVANLEKEWYGRYNERYDDNLSIDKVHSWDTHKYAKAGMKVYSVLNDPGFFRCLEPYPGAISSVKALHEDGHRIVVVTACPMNATTGAHDKQLWVREHMPFVAKNDIVLTHSKDLVRGDVLIDDGPHNITAYRKAFPDAFITGISFPYNAVPDAQQAADLLAPDYRDPESAWKAILQGVRDFAKWPAIVLL